MKWPKFKLPEFNFSRPQFAGAGLTKKAIIAVLLGTVIILAFWTASNFTKGEQVDPDLLLNTPKKEDMKMVIMPE